MNAKTKENYTPKLYKDKVTRKLTALETYLSKGEFDKFFKAAKEVTSEELKDLKEVKKGLPNELDNMLFNFSKYGFRTEKVEKEDEEDQNRLVINIPGEEKKVEKIKIMRENALEALDVILNLGANPNTLFEKGVTPFMKICSTNSLEMVKMLVENPDLPANVDQNDGGGNRALSFAVLADQPEIIEYLVKEQNSDMNFKTILSMGQTVFHQACLHAKVNSVSKLIELNANPTIADINGLLPGELIPQYDEEEDDIDAIDPKEMEKWEQLFQDVLAYYKKYKENNKPKKLTF